MADTTILSGDIGVTWWNNNRQKRLEWIGGTETSYTMNELYSAMQTLQDETTTIDDGTAFSAETPVEYTIGTIDAGDNEPWYISFDLMEHITGGALKTKGWARTGGGTGDTGIVVVAVSSTSQTIVAADAGHDITNGSTSDSGTLLEVLDDGGSTHYLVIRPDSNAAANDFDGTTGTLTCNSHTAATITAGATTGNQIWANVYSIGTIDSNVHLYVCQGSVAADGDRVRLASWNDSTQDWYDNGHIDICVALKDITTSTWDTIDGGYLTVHARKSGDLFASFEVANSTTSGGRNPVPLQTAVDLDGGTGLKKIMTTGGWTGVYVDGEIISGNVTGARGIVDLTNSDTSSEQYIVYHPIDDPQIDFTTSDTVVTGAASGATSAVTTSAADNGPSTTAFYTGSTLPTITFANDQADIDNDGTDEQYGITIDCQGARLTEVYEWCKWQCRNGEQTNDLDGIDGEQYLGGEVYIKYGSSDTISGTINEGDDVTQETSGATGVIISLDTTSKTMLLRNTRGTWATGDATSHTITSTDNGGTVEVDSNTDDAEVATFAPKTASPLGTFAGGTFFGARGVLLSNWHSNDENSFILTDLTGTTNSRPASVQFSVTNLVGGAETSAVHDRVAIFRLLSDGGDIARAEHAIAGTPSAGDATVGVNSSPGIGTDTPSEGSLVIVDSPEAANATEYKIRYSSWSSATDIFTLANVPAFTTTGTNTDTQVEYSGGSFETTVKRGDLVYNSTQGAVGYVKTVDSDTVLTLEGSGISGNATGNSVEINCIPVALTSADDLYVPLMDRVATSDTESVSVVYDSTIYFRVKVRNTRAATKIKPYSSDGSTSGTNQSIPVVRTEDTIIA